MRLSLVPMKKTNRKTYEFTAYTDLFNLFFEFLLNGYKFLRVSHIVNLLR